ncbi:TMEM175 family protein [Streptomyces sp. NPDC051546]|uniref:TMEM175 family protein n=1 Tax=Streptomyces sp. NPDC051546 TaxID=3365655 RepID=UPI00378FBE63
MAVRDPGGAEKAEGSPDRLMALSDGIYAIVLTLLVLDIKVSDGLDAAAFRQAVVDLWPQLAAYLWSFYILATFWRDHRRLFLRVRRADTLLLRLTLASLGAVALLPFTTGLLEEYRTQSLAIALYAAVITCIVGLHLTIAATVWRRKELQADHVSDQLGSAVVRDLGVTVIVLALSVPAAFVSPVAALCLWILLIPAKVVTGRHTRIANRSTGIGH